MQWNLNCLWCDDRKNGKPRDSSVKDTMDNTKHHAEQMDTREKTPNSNNDCSNNQTPANAKRSRKFSQLSSPVSPACDDILPVVPLLPEALLSESRLNEILTEALKPAQEKLDELIESQVIMDEQASHLHSILNHLKMITGSWNLVLLCYTKRTVS